MFSNLLTEKIITIIITIIRPLAAASIKPRYFKLVIQERNTSSNFIISPLVITTITTTTTSPNIK